MIHVHATAKVHHSKSDPVLFDLRDSFTGCAGGHVRWTHNRLPRVEVLRDFFLVESVITQRDRISARLIEFFGNLRRNANPTGRVLSVDHNKEGLVVIDEAGKALSHDGATGFANHVAQK